MLSRAKAADDRSSASDQFGGTMIDTYANAAPDRGFVFAATGPDFTNMARSAVRSLRQAMPQAVVDLFTDQPVEDNAFDAIHQVEHVWFRPKMEALRRSRFISTVFLDADVVVRHDISELFDVLARHDMTGAQMIRTNQGVATKAGTSRVPPCFPQINSGVLGVRQNQKTRDLLRTWEERVHTSGAGLDQPTLRELLWDRDVRVHVLPCQYNMMSHRLMGHWDSSMMAPRVLHLGAIRPPYLGEPTRPYELENLIGRPMLAHIQALEAADATLGGDATHAVAPLCGTGDTRSDTPGKPTAPRRWWQRRRFSRAGR